jgi:hypothetical protein
MSKIFLLLNFLISFPVFAQTSSMRRCTLLPITDSVEGAIGYKVFEWVEEDLKKSNWCTYVSNSGLMNVFSRYRRNLPQHLKSKEVLVTVAERLKVGSIIRVSMVNELRGVELQMEVYGDNGEDIYFSEKSTLKSDEIETIASRVRNWLDMYSKMIPYDAKVTGVLGDQLTLDVGKGYPIQIGQKFVVKRLLSKKKHPLLKKIVDWETVPLAEGSIFNISDNQALGMVKAYRGDNKVQAGDWVRLEEAKEDVVIKGDDALEEKHDTTPGSLGVLSVALFGSSTTINTGTNGGSYAYNGNLVGMEVKGEAWITRQYFAALEIMRGFGTLHKDTGPSAKSKITTDIGSYKIKGGYKYLPIGFFYGPQVDFYTGYASKFFGTDKVSGAGLGSGQNVFSGILLGIAANVPLNREYKFFVDGEFLPFPSFSGGDSSYSGAKNISSLEFELGIRYQYTARMTLDGSFEMRSSGAKFSGTTESLRYRDNLLKLGASFNF